MKKKLFIPVVLGVMVLATACGKSVSLEEAKNIAFSDAGVTAEEVTVTKEKQDEGDYEVAFQTADAIYEYEIKKNGSIDSKEREMLPSTAAPAGDTQATAQATEVPKETDKVKEDVDDAAGDTGTGQTPGATTETPVVTDGSSGQDIGQEQAKNIALERAGLTEDQVQRLEVRQDMEDGLLVYEVEFDQNRTEYSVDVNAATGEIVKFDQDMD